MRFKVTEGSWKGAEGEYVRDEGANVVLKMAGYRLVEFKPEQVDMIMDEAADEKKAEAE